MIKAPKRHRRKRIQKKIDKRFGLLHYDLPSIFILSLQKTMSHLDPLVQDDTLNELGRQMTEIVKKSNRLSSELLQTM